MEHMSEIRSEAQGPWEEGRPPGLWGAVPLGLASSARARVGELE